MTQPGPLSHTGCSRAVLRAAQIFSGFRKSGESNIAVLSHRDSGVVCYSSTSASYPDFYTSLWTLALATSPLFPDVEAPPPPSTWLTSHPLGFSSVMTDSMKPFVIFILGAWYKNEFYCVCSCHHCPLLAEIDCNKWLEFSMEGSLYLFELPPTLI